MTEPATIDLQKVCDILASEHSVTAYVEQTGGGCATIYAGEPWDEANWGNRYPAVAGPGWFDGPGWTLPRGDLHDFYIGPDDDGESDDITRPLDDHDETAVARLIAAAVAEYQRS